MDGEGRVTQDCPVNGLLGFQALVLRQQNLGRVGLGIHVDEENVLAFAGKSCGEGDARGCFAGAAFLRSNRYNHTVIRSEARTGYSFRIDYIYHK